MLRAIAQERSKETGIRVAAIAVFVVLMAISAKISIPLEPVPFTLQVLVVLLSGMVLGWRDALITQVTYVGLIALGAPLDARGVGSAALFGATGGFLFGFMPAAAITGFLVERATSKTLWLRWIAGLVGVVVIYVFGLSHFMLYRGEAFQQAFMMVVQPFIVLDMVKAILAAGLTESARTFFKK
jgi:biotin transport system substrate-specific component